MRTCGERRAGECKLEGTAVDFKDALQIYNEQFAAYQTLWNMYFLVAFGIIALFGSTPAAAKDEKVRVGLTLAFGLFAFSNFLALTSVSEQRILIRDVVISKATPDVQPIAQLLADRKPAAHP